MNVRALVTAVLFLVSFQLTAIDRKGYFLSLEDVTVKSSLTGYYVASVINASRENSCVGFVQKGMFNRREPAWMKPSIQEEVEKCLKRSFATEQNNKPLIVRINLLRVYEITWSNRELAFADVSLSFLTKDSAGYTVLFTAGRSVEAGGLDVTGAHDQTVARAMTGCFNDLMAMAGKGFPGSRKIAASSLTENPLDHPGDFGIFKLKRFSKGLFHSFYDLRDGNCDSITPFDIRVIPDKKDPSNPRAEVVLPDGTTDKASFAVSDGNNLFVRTGNRFAIVFPDTSNLVLRLNHHEIQKDAGSGAMMGVMFGAVGGLISALAASAQAKDAVGRGEGNCIVDFTSGKLVPRNTPEYLRTESNTILFLSRSSAVGSDLSVMFRQDTLCNLQPGEYIHLRLPSGFEQITLHFCGKQALVTDQTFDLEPFLTTVYLARIRRNGEVILNMAVDQVRKDILDGMDSQNTCVIRSPGTEPTVN